MPGQDTPITGTDPQTQETALQYAINMLRSKNIHEYKSRLVCTGMLVWPNGKAVESGSVVAFANKGKFTGNWIIQKVKHYTANDKFMTELEFRKCLVPRATQVQPAGIGG